MSVWRRWFVVSCWFAGLALFAPSGGDAASKEPSSDSSAGGRIAFYRARIGGPGTYPAYARLGLACLQKYRETGKSNYHGDALRYLRQSLEYQRNFEALLGLAMGLSERHYFKEALPYAEEALSAMPSDLEAAGTLFDIQLALGRVAEAEANLNVMLNAQRGFHAWSRLAALRDYKSDRAGALAAMIQARDASSHHYSKATVAWAEVRLGALYVRNCDPTNSYAAYQRALALVPEYGFAKEHLAEWHAAQGHWREAETLFRALMKSHPATQYRLALAEIYRTRQGPRAARREEEKALEEMLHDERDGAQDQLRPLALFLVERLDGLADGLRYARRDWEVRQDALAADAMSWALLRNGQAMEALRFSETALKSGNKDAGLLLHAGIIRCRANHIAEGRTLLEQALACPLAFGPAERRLAAEAQEELGKTL